MQENETKFASDAESALAQPQSKKRKPPPRRKPKSTGQLFLKLLLKIAVIALSVWAVLSFVLCVNVHYGNNMHPSVRDGDLIISYRLQKPFLEAVVLYEQNGKTNVGRVIALGGDEVNVAENGALTVNGVAPSEEVFYPTLPAAETSITYPYTVPEGCAFVLNDFRKDTNDSRAFGAVNINKLKGCALLSIRRRGF